MAIDEVDINIIRRLKKLEDDLARTKTMESIRPQRVSRVTTTPYAVLGSDGVMFVDTDPGAITVNLPAGVNGRHYIIINCGSSAHAVTINPHGAELINGVNAPVTLADGLKVDYFFNTVEGWR